MKVAKSNFRWWYLYFIYIHVLNYELIVIFNYWPRR